MNGNNSAKNIIIDLPDKLVCEYCNKSKSREKLRVMVDLGASVKPSVTTIICHECAIELIEDCDELSSKHDKLVDLVRRHSKIKHTNKLYCSVCEKKETCQIDLSKMNGKLTLQRCGFTLNKVKEEILDRCKRISS